MDVPELLRKVEQARDRLVQETGREPSDEEAAREAGVPLDQLTELMQATLVEEPLSLPGPVGGGVGFWEGVDPAAHQNALEDTWVRDVLSEAIGATLEPLEREVMELRYGLDNGRSMSLREVGEAVGVSAETVRKVERGALRKLREAEDLQDI